MKRMMIWVAILAALASCQSGPDQRTPLPPLPEKISPMPYARLLERARSLSKQATEAFYVDNWGDLEEAARGLEQTAQYLIKAEDVPGKHRDTLSTMSADLGKLSKELREAAVAKDVKKTTDILTKIQVQVREMRLSEGV